METTKPTHTVKNKLNQLTESITNIQPDYFSQDQKQTLIQQMNEITALLEMDSDTQHANSGYHKKLRDEQQEVLQKATKYEFLSEFMLDVVWILDLESQRFTFVSPSVQKLRGYTPDEVVRQPMQMAMTPKSLQYIQESLPKRLNDFLEKPQDKSVYWDEVDQYCKDGSIISTEMYSYFRINPENQRIEIIGVSRDISKRKDAERALKASEAKFRLSFENASIGVCLIDLDGKLLKANHTFTSMVGYSTEELDSMSIYDLTLQEDWHLTREYYHQIKFVGQIAASYHKRYKHKNGMIIHVEAASTLIRDEDNNPLYFISHVLDVTEKTRAEQRLRQSEQLYKTLFHDTASIMLLIDANTGKIMDANKAACEFYGYEYIDLIQMNISQINVLPPEVIRNKIAQAKKKNCNKFLFEHKLASGEIRTVEVYTSQIDLEKRETLYSIIYDVTDRIQMEQALQAERKQFLTLLNSINEIIYVADPHTYELLFVNHRVKEVFGQNIVGQKCYHVLQNKEEPCDFCTNPYIFTTEKKTHSWEFHNANVDATYYIFDKAISWTDGRDVRFELAFDITQLKEAEKQLKKLTTAVEQNPASIVITDTQGSIEYVNPAFTHVTGYSLEEAKGKNPSLLKSGKVPTEVYKDLWKTIQAGNIWQGELINKKKSGETYWEQAIIAPIKNDEEIINFLAVKTDITPSKIAQEALQHSEKELREANITKNKFFSIIAHDLKSPFNALVGLIQLILDDMETYSRHELKEMLVSLQNSAKQSYDLLENLLTWAHTQSGKIHYKPESINLAALFKTAVQAVSPIAEKKAITITYDYEAGLSLYVDINMLHTVIRNMLYNSIKFTHRKGNIVIGAYQDTEQWVVMYIKDTGIGMKDEIIQNLFKIEYSFSLPGTEKERGTGLGLILCKEFIEKHNGSIWVESQVNKGSTFYIKVPAKSPIPVPVE